MIWTKSERRQSARLGLAAALLIAMCGCGPAPAPGPDPDRPYVPLAPTASMSGIEAKIAEGDFATALRMFRDLPADVKLQQEVQERWMYVAERNGAKEAPTHAQKFVDEIANARTKSLTALSIDKVSDLPSLFAVQEELEGHARFLAENSGEDLRNALTPAQKKAVASFEELLATKQATALPQLRARYAALVDQGLWVNNLDAEITGKANRELVLIAPDFADRGEIAKVLEVAQLDLVKLRFAKVHFRSFVADTEQSTFDLATSGDRVLGLSAPDGIRPL